MAKKDRTRKSAVPDSVDPGVADVLKKARENKAALTKKQKRDRLRCQALYDLPPALKAAIKEEAAHPDVSTSASQLAALLLAYGLKELRSGNEELTEALEAGKDPSRTMRFEWNVDLPEEWMALLERTAAGHRPDDTSDSIRGSTDDIWGGWNTQ